MTKSQELIENAGRILSDDDLERIYKESLENYLKDNLDKTEADFVKQEIKYTDEMIKRLSE